MRYNQVGRSLSIIVCALILVVAADSAAMGQSNATPSLKTSLNPNCKIADALSLTANVTANIATQNVCNIAANATSVGLYVTVSAASAGSLKIWEADGAEPSFGVISYPSGTSSFYADPRVCAPHFECLYGVAAEATTNVSLTLIPTASYAAPE